MSQALGRATWFTAAACAWPVWCLALLLVVLALPTAQSLAISWERNPDYAHGWLLLPATFWLMYRATPWAVAAAPQWGLGIITMLAGGFVHLTTIVIPWPLIDYAGWVLLIRGVALAWWGREAAQRMMPALAFAVLLFPLPMVWLNQIAMLLQDVIARAAELVLGLFWVCHRRGQLLYLAGMDEPLSVALECSGVRQLLVFVALAWFLAFYLQGSMWRRVGLVLAAVPLAIIANVARVLALAVIARLAGSQSINGPLHDIPLLITLPVGGLLLWLLYQRLQMPATTIAVQKTPGSALPTPWVLLAAACSLVGLQLLLQLHLQAGFIQHQAERINLETLPLQLGNWQGSPHPEAERIAKQAEFADGTLLRAYGNNQGQAAAVYLVYSSNGRDRLHHPEICLRDAAGATAIPAGERIIPLLADGSRTAQRFRYQRAQQKQVTVYYWHYTLTPTFSAPQSFLQRLHWMQHEQWPSITVQVQTNMTDPAAWQAIEATLLPEVDRCLRQQLPATVQTGSERLPIRMTWLR